MVGGKGGRGPSTSVTIHRSPRPHVARAVPGVRFGAGQAEVYRFTCVSDVVDLAHVAWSLELRQPCKSVESRSPFELRRCVDPVSDAASPKPIHEYAGDTHQGTFDTYTGIGSPGERRGSKEEQHACAESFSGERRHKPPESE